LFLFALGCAQGVSAPNAPQPGAPSAVPASATGLTGTQWRLIEFRSSDDAIGIVKPSDPALYTMALSADGSVAFRLNCNRGTGTWKAAATSEETGTFTFSPIAMTRALCPPPSMDERIARDAGFVRSYVMKDGLLYLSLMADGGIYAWEPE
jgi:heat shock protein HslJ